MDANEAQKELATIRRIMESATQLTVLPGWAAVLGGAVALAGAAASAALLGSLDFADAAGLSDERRGALIALWVAVALIGIGFNVALSVRLARRRGISPWSRIFQLATYAMLPAVAAALMVSLHLARRGEWGTVPAVWMLLYGAAVWMASVLSIRAPGLVGAAFFVMGTVTLFWLQGIGVVMVAVSFGAVHIVYGVYLLRRFGA